MVDQEKLKQLTPLAKDLIENRQQIASIIIKIVPWASVALLVMGTLLFGVGLFFWWNKQQILDETDRQNLDRLKTSPKLSPEEIAAKGKEEASETSVVEGASRDAAISSRSLSSAADMYMKIERLVLAQLARSKPKGFALLEQRRIGMRSFDAVLAKESGSGPDILIEIKYYTRPPTKGAFYGVRDRIVATSLDYQKTTNRTFKNVLLVVVPSPEVRERLVREWISPILERSKEPIGISLFVLDETQLLSTDFAELFSGEGFLI